MSGSKFASITSSLLARKGEAKPWTEPGSQTWRPVEVEEVREQAFPPPNISHFVPPAEPEMPEPRSPALHKTCSIKMSFQEYERLGIMAVKVGQTRQRLLQEALHQLLASMAQEYRVSCACLERGEGSDGGCCQG
jgi:predicted DNA-binding protein